MQLILANWKPSPSERLCNSFRHTVDETHILQQLQEQCHPKQKQMSEEDKAREKLVSELSNDVGSLNVLCFLNHGQVHDDATYEMRVVLFSCDKSILKSLVRKFQEKVTISVTLYFTRNAAPEESTAQIDASCSIQGMKIDPKTFTCDGTPSVSPEDAAILMGQTAIDRLEIVADITGPFSKRAPSAAEKVLERRAFSDLVIVAGNGAEIKANKCFVSVCSPTLEAMLGSGMEESRTGRIDMSDLSEEGVEAFLRYIYVEDLEQPKQDISVAFELLYASHKYGVSNLETEMKTLLNDMKNEDFDVNVAFRMYMFTRNIVALAELKMKALQVLRDKMDELDSLEEFNELFDKPSHSKTVKELCKDLAKTLSP